MHDRHRQPVLLHLTNMLDSIRTYSTRLQRPILLLHITDRLPALLSRLWAAYRPMDKVQVDVPKATRVERALDCSFHTRVPIVQLELRGVEDLLARDVVLLTEVADRLADLALVLVPLGRVLSQRRGSVRYAFPAPGAWEGSRCGGTRSKGESVASAKVPCPRR